MEYFIKLAWCKGCKLKIMIASLNTIFPIICHPSGASLLRSSPTMQAGDRRMLRAGNTMKGTARWYESHLNWLTEISQIPWAQTLVGGAISIKVYVFSITMFASLAVFLLFVKDETGVLSLIMINKAHEVTKTSDDFILLTILSVSPKFDNATDHCCPKTIRNTWNT